MFKSKPNSPLYWLDFNSGEFRKESDGENFYIKCKAVKMPYKYVIEMFCDFIGAAKVYNKETWTTSTPLNYWKAKGEGKRLMHKDSLELFTYLITLLSRCNELKQFYKIYHTLKNDIKVRYKKGNNLYNQLDRIYEAKIDKILQVK